MSTVLARLGRFAFRRRRRVLAAWLIVLAVFAGAAVAFSGHTDNEFTIPGTESQQAIDTLTARFPAAGGSSAELVFVAPKGTTLAGATAQAAIRATLAAAEKVDGVTAVVPPSATKIASSDGTLAVAQVTFGTLAGAVPDSARQALEATAAPARSAGLTLEFGGEIFGSTGVAISGAEGVGVLIAFLVLIITFGGLIAAGMPLVTGLVGVGVGLSGVFAVSKLITLSSTAPVLALMLGLAVGIDYALFIVSRHRSQLASGMSGEDSASLAVGTAGGAVVFAGLTVIIALAGFCVVGIPFLTVMGLAAAFTVLITVLVALTLVPAMLGFAGDRLVPGPGSRALRRETERATLGRRWVALVTRHPLPVLLVGVIGLGAVALPAHDLRLGLPSAGSAAPGATQRKAYDLLSRKLGPGFNGPLTVLVDTSRPDPPSRPATAASIAARTVASRLAALPDVATVTAAQPDRSDRLAVFSVVPSSAPDSAATTNLVKQIRAGAGRLRADTGAAISVTGHTAVQIDVSDSLSSALPVFILVIVGLALILLCLVFRSIVVPVKAVAGFLLTLGASLGAVVAVFQWGWLSGVLGVDRTGPVVSFLPVIMVGILFGLAMDYEVFLVSRMREEFVHGDEPLAAVRSGFGAGARVVTAAALIMTSVFAGFAAGHDPVIKPIGFALALGVLLDAFVVRMTLVPALMALVGRRAWWIPQWLDRVLPDLDIEGEALRGTRPPAGEPQRLST
jgi:RND superfamily putative drug exporter